MARLVKIGRVNEIEGFPIRANTLRKWLYVRRHLEIFVRVGNLIFIDLDRFERLVQDGRLK